ncbi:MAG: hypothetical protein AAGA18_01735 [Verrucomicrobiota bacterium]
MKSNISTGTMKIQRVQRSHETYNSFWPLTIVIAALCVMTSVQIYQMLEQRTFLKQNVDNLQPAIQEARVISGTISQLSRELLLLSSESNEARRIVQEFQIRPTGQQAAMASAASGGGAAVPAELPASEESPADQ